MSKSVLLGAFSTHFTRGVIMDGFPIGNSSFLNPHLTRQEYKQGQDFARNVALPKAVQVINTVSAVKDAIDKSEVDITGEITQNAVDSVHDLIGQ